MALGNSGMPPLHNTPSNPLHACTIPTGDLIIHTLPSWNSEDWVNLTSRCDSVAYHININKVQMFDRDCP